MSKKILWLVIAALYILLALFSCYEMFSGVKSDDYAKALFYMLCAIINGSVGVIFIQKVFR